MSLPHLRWSFVGAAAALSLLAGSAAAGNGPGFPASPLAQLPTDAAAIVDVESLMEDPDCDTAQLLGPAATSTEHLGAGAKTIVLDTFVLVDVAQGAKIASTKDKRKRAAAEKALFGEMRDRLKAAAASYEPLGIELRLSRFALLQPLDAKGAPRKRTDDATEIIRLSKQQFGGKRPAGIDVVYTITDIDIQVPGIGKAVAGLADCIGGVGLADRAFAVGETVEGDARKSSVPLNLGKYSAKIAAHEIGHLMGAHHHYQECGTPVPTAVSQGEVGPCSLMTNLANFLTLPISQLNGVVVRGHAEEFATATDAPRR